MIFFCLFPSAAPVFSRNTLGTISSLPPSSPIPRLSDSQLFVNTIYFPRLEPKYWYKIPLFYGQQQLIVNLSGPCITLTVLTVISSPPKELQKSGFIRLLLPFFSFARQRIFENGCFESCESKKVKLKIQILRREEKFFKILFEF